jgi:hypothetical protein
VPIFGTPIGPLHFPSSTTTNVASPIAIVIVIFAVASDQQHDGKEAEQRFD